MNRGLRSSCFLLLLTLGVGCSNATNLPPPFVFDTPGEVALVCFDTTPGLASEKEASADDKTVLPFECCTPAGCDLPGIKPVAHALVTQIVNGEVAAVDLLSNKVLDSERRIPGFTFVNVGGLPSAIVVPKKMPPEPALEPMDGPPAEMPEPAALMTGPIWTYVAGREKNSIRAIPTCRFYLGRPCGPEIVRADEDGLIGSPATRADFRRQTELLLPEAPGDMVLDPSGAALWITLPSEGLVARVALGTSKDRLVLEGQTQETVAPFSFDAVGAVAPPVYFRVDDEIKLEPLPPIAEPPRYEALCGLGAFFDTRSVPPLVLRTAPHDRSSEVAEPTRMRLLAPADAAGEPLLLVADRGQVVLHTYAIVGDVLEKRGVQSVGARLRDFAVTPRVPVETPPIAALAAGDLDDVDSFVYGEGSPFTVDEKQYLYGIDDRGGVMLFDLTFEGREPRLQPLLAPVPHRDSTNMQNNYADRLLINDGETPARALDVVDTRVVDPGHRTEEFCGGVNQKNPLDSEVATAERELRDARNALSQAKKRKEDAAVIRARERDVQLAEQDLVARRRRAAVPVNAGPRALRGVFVVVVASNGRVTVLDVHDLDLQCRARKSCEGDQLERLSDVSSATAVALRRHTPRIDEFEPANVSVIGTDELEPVDCPEGYQIAEAGTNVCTPSDPWRTRNGTWSVIYEGPAFDVPDAVIALEEVQSEDGSTSQEMVLRAPVGFDLCKRGALGATPEGGALFQVAIASLPVAETITVDGRNITCPTPTPTNAQRLWVKEAFVDHLVLKRPDDPQQGRTDLSDAQLLACYADFVGVEVRLHDAYLVTNGTYLHRTSAGDDGRCVVKEPKPGEPLPEGFVDPLFTSRAVAGERFQDPSVSFVLASGSADAEDVNPSITIARQATTLSRSNVDGTSGRSDALPRRVRFFPETGELFIVDQASQGLKRFTLSPFEFDSSRFR